MENYRELRSRAIKFEGSDTVMFNLIAQSIDWCLILFEMTRNLNSSHLANIVLIQKLFLSFNISSDQVLQWSEQVTHCFRHKRLRFYLELTLNQTSNLFLKPTSNHYVIFRNYSRCMQTPIKAFPELLDLTSKIIEPL